MCVGGLVSSSSTSSGSVYIDPRVSRKCSGFQSVSLQTISNDCEILRLPLFGAVVSGVLQRWCCPADGDVSGDWMSMWGSVLRRERRSPRLPPRLGLVGGREGSSRAAVGIPAASDCSFRPPPPAPVRLFMLISVIRPTVLAPPRALFTPVAPAPDTPGRNQRRVITLIRKLEVVSTARLNKTLEDI